jgi:hypothetical protein
MSSSLFFTNGAWDGNYYHNFTATNLLAEFKTMHNVELVINLKLNIKDTMAGVIRRITEPFKSPKVTVTSSTTLVVQSGNIFVSAVIGENQNPFLKESRTVDMTVHGGEESLEAFAGRMDQYIHTDDVYVKWWFKNAAKELNKIQFTLEDKKPFRPEHYPFIKNADDYIQRFTDSQASVLVLLGEPGTGKTSFIRHLLRQAKCECFITYDEDVMYDDLFYVNFLSDKTAEYLILEDADLLLTERVQDNNKIMSKILNTSDGLISLGNKKIIFTANIRDETRIDEALVRPGRCFDVLKFRPLTIEESTGIAKNNGIELSSTKQEFTLAEIFNSKN